MSFRSRECDTLLVYLQIYKSWLNAVTGKVDFPSFQLRDKSGLGGKLLP